MGKKNQKNDHPDQNVIQTRRGNKRPINFISSKVDVVDNGKGGFVLKKKKESLDLDDVKRFFKKMGDKKLNNSKSIDEALVQTDEIKSNHENTKNLVQQKDDVGSNVDDSSTSDQIDEIKSNENSKGLGQQKDDAGSKVNDSLKELLNDQFSKYLGAITDVKKDIEQHRKEIDEKLSNLSQKVDSVSSIENKNIKSNEELIVELTEKSKLIAGDKLVNLFEEDGVVYKVSKDLLSRATKKHRVSIFASKLFSSFVNVPMIYRKTISGKSLKKPKEAFNSSIEKQLISAAKIHILNSNENYEQVIHEIIIVKLANFNKLFNDIKIGETYDNKLVDKCKLSKDDINGLKDLENYVQDLTLFEALDKQIDSNALVKKEKCDSEIEHDESSVGKPVKEDDKSKNKEKEKAKKKQLSIDDKKIKKKKDQVKELMMQILSFQKDQIEDDSSKFSVHDTDTDLESSNEKDLDE